MLGIRDIQQMIILEYCNIYLFITTYTMQLLFRSNIRIYFKYRYCVYTRARRVGVKKKINHHGFFIFKTTLSFRFV